MARFSAIVCDHCDARDVVEHPQKHNIQTVDINIRISGATFKSFSSELCEKCLHALGDEVFRLATQEPRSA